LTDLALYQFVSREIRQTGWSDVPSEAYLVRDTARSIPAFVLKTSAFSKIAVLGRFDILLAVTTQVTTAEVVGNNE
jgi:hypothetical protein